MDYAIRLERAGPPEVMQLVEVPVREPGHGEVLVRHEAIAVNYLDVQQRSGQYPLPMPSGLGMEAAGRIAALGPGVEGVALGDRVVYIASTPGSYSTARLCPARSVVRIPDALDTEAVASMFTRGLMAWHLVNTVRAVDAADRILVHAAGGGVGSLVCQLAKRSGAQVIGVATTAEEAALADEAGCDHVLTGTPDLAAQVRGLTGGQGVAVVYDPVGRTTFAQSLDCLAPHGLMVAYGNLSGPIPSFEPMRELGMRGSLQLAWPMLKDFMAPHMAAPAAAGLFAAMVSGLRVGIGQKFSLADAPLAHRVIEERRLKGVAVLLP